MIETTISAATNVNGQLDEREITREEFERVILSLMTDPDSKMARLAKRTERGTYTHIKFAKTEGGKYFEFKIFKEDDGWRRG